MYQGKQSFMSSNINSLRQYQHLEDIQVPRLTRYRGKGTPRRKVKKVSRTGGTDDKKLQASLKKINVQPIQGIEEVNMFKSDGNVIHFANPKGQQHEYINDHG